MDFFDWNNLQLFHYIAIGGGVVLVLALLLYLLPASTRDKMRVPGIVVGIIGGIAVGSAAGAVGLARYGEPKRPAEAAAGAAAGVASGGPGAMMAPGFGGPGGPGGGPGRPGRGGPGGPVGFGGGPPDHKVQLGNLVDRVIILALKPPTFTLTDEQKKQALAQLDGLEKPDELSQEEAEKRLEALQKVLEGQSDSLRKISTGGPGRGGPGGRPPTPPNPFKEEKKAQELKELRAWLSGEKPKKEDKSDKK